MSETYNISYSRLELPRRIFYLSVSKKGGAVFCTTSMLEKVSQIRKTYLLDQQLFCWRHFSKTEVVQNIDLNILAL